MCKKRRESKNNSGKWVAATAFLILVIAGVALWFLTSDDEGDKGGQKQESTELRVAQFYLHLPERDFIIGRQNPKFEEFKKLSGAIIAGIKKDGQANKQLNTETIKQLEREHVSITIWLMEPTKLDKDLSTDRILILLGGAEAGQVYLKQAEAENWTLRKAGDQPVKALVEVVRKGGI